MHKGAAVFFTPGDSPKRGLDTLYQKGHIGRSVAVVVFLAKFKIRNLAAGSGQIWNFEFCGVATQSSSIAIVGSRRRFPCKIRDSKIGRGERPNFEF